jgi:hypothetical protein
MKMTIDQSDKVNEALSKLSALLNTMNSACCGDAVELSDLSYMFSYALNELDKLIKISDEIGG